MNPWFIFLYQPLVNALIAFYKILGGNLGLSIIGLTLAIRAVLIPLTAPSLKAAQKLRQLQPELEKLKKKYKGNKTAFARAQLELYQKHGANPMGGCLPQIVQIIILIALFQAFSQVLAPDGEIVDKLNQVLYSPLRLAQEEKINTRFFYLDLTKPDMLPLPFALGFGKFALTKIPGIFLVGAAIVQFLSSRAMIPSVAKEKKLAKKTPAKEDDMAVVMQEQMLYLMPVMTILIGFTFPSGLVLYWLTFSLFMLVQQKLSHPRGGGL